ncbi:MAG: hypothetical protein QOD98_2717 [Nocardioidaceae bacterium]|nr:hypothetical protein [Nocardioidaceae bacterium]
MSTPTDSARPGLDLREITMALAELGEGMTDAERIDAIREAEELICAAQALQARLSVDLDSSVQSAATARGVPAARLGRGVAHQVALARRESPHRAERRLQLAKIAPAELPCATTAWTAGRINEWRVTLLARETACLSVEDRLTIDAELAADPTVIEAMGDSELVAEVRRRAYALDPEAFVERRRRAEADRHTSLRPAPDTMAMLSALLSVKNGVAVHAALSAEADRAKAAGDPRSRGQIMADTLTSRVVSPSVAEVATGPLMVNVIVSEQVLLGDPGTDGAAEVEGYGPVPGELLRSWIADHLEAGVDVFVRRIYETPATGALVAMDSKARLFPARLAEFLRLRDPRCRTRYCDAPARDADHATAHVEGGATSAANGQCLCEGCNIAKEAYGWSARPRPGPRHTVETTTPTGHTYTSVAPRFTPPPLGTVAVPKVELAADFLWPAA